MEMGKSKQPDDRKTVERVQTGIRIEKRMLKVLKGLAECLDITLGDLVEGIVLHAFPGHTKSHRIAKAVVRTGSERTGQPPPHRARSQTQVRVRVTMTSLEQD